MPYDAELADPLCSTRTEQAALLADAPWRRFAALGDSLSKGTGDPSPGYEPRGWPDRVAAALREVDPHAAYLNTAVVGATTPDAFAQWEAVRDFGPDLLHLPCGANDIVRRRPDWDRVEHDLRALHDLAASTGALVFTFTLGRAYDVPAFPDFAERRRRVNDIVRVVAADQGAFVVEMADHPVNDRAGLVSADGLHFAGVGQAVMASEVVRCLAAARRPA